MTSEDLRKAMEGQQLSPAWAELAAKLVWLYGPERARDILDGEDRATEADIAAWRSLGVRR
jgi:hypothetical protein